MTGYEMVEKWRAAESDETKVPGSVVLDGNDCADEFQPFLESLSAAVKEFTGAANEPDFHFEYRDAMQRCADAIERIVGRKP